VELVGTAKRVRIYVSEDDRVGTKPAHLAVLELLRAENARGATVFRGMEGFGGTGQLHVSHLVDVAQALPLVVEWIDTAEAVARLLPRVEALVPRGLVTVDATEVVLYQPRPVRTLPAALCAADAMSRAVTTVAPETPLREVVERMLGKLYRAVPVVDGGVPVGIVTNGDLVRRGDLDVRLELLESLEPPQLREVLDHLGARGRTAGDVMTARPLTVRADTPLPRVAELMAHRRLKRLPVVDAGGRLVGVVSRLDLLRIAGGGFAQNEPVARDLGLHGNAPLAEVMRRDVPTVHPETPLPEVFQAVIATRLNRALVVDAERRVVGVVTDAEMLDRLTPSLRPGALRSLMHRLPFVHSTPEERVAEQHGRARRAADLMTTGVATAREDAHLSDAIRLMLRDGQKVLAVTDAEGRLVGIVDRADLLHGLLRAG
jgi:CBS domain-containing protein/PII-like signaling protein